MNDAADTGSPYLTKTQARRHIGGDRAGGVSERWLERQRIRRYRIGGLVRYLRADLDDFIARHAVEVARVPTSRLRAAPARAPRRDEADTRALDDFLNN